MGRQVKIYRCKNCTVDSTNDIRLYPNIVNTSLGGLLEFSHVGCGCNAHCPKCNGKSNKNLIRVR